MSGGNRIDAALLLLASALVAAFLVSFGLGIRGGAGGPGDAATEHTRIGESVGTDPADGSPEAPGPGDDDAASAQPSAAPAERLPGGRRGRQAAGTTDRGLIRVEVLNAAGRAGLAREVTDRLIDEGFDVVFFGNARAFGRDSSLVIDRSGDLDAARLVAAALGIGEVRTDPDPDLALNATVLLGADWQPPLPPADSGWLGAVTALWSRLKAALPL